MSIEEFEVDEYNRRLRDNATIPDFATSKRCDVWRGGVLDPTTVLTGWRHKPSNPCKGGWIRSADWWFVCGACHPDAVDKATGGSRNRPIRRRT